MQDKLKISKRILYQYLSDPDIDEERFDYIQELYEDEEIDGEIESIENGEFSSIDFEMFEEDEWEH